MSNRYAPLPNPRSDRDPTTEMDDAFDDSDDHDNVLETHPLNPHSHTELETHSPPSHPGAYNFEADPDWDRPPPGSPPTVIGNSNGFIPNAATVRAPQRRAPAWLSKWLPARAAPAGAVGGGTNNDGVFANVTAKPSRPVRIGEGDESYLVPEDALANAPPSYASAQADAAPPYWDTTVHASAPELLVDALPAGSLFTFAWTTLISAAFQVPGFLITYLLHTTHAGRAGARAGLGITLVQYGFSLRASKTGASGGGSWWGAMEDPGWSTDPAQPTPAAAPTAPHFDTAAEAESWYATASLATPTSAPMPTETITQEEAASQFVADATTEWLAFFMMTVGWFLLLTSILSYWRVKRWERNILVTQQPSGSSSPPVTTEHGIFHFRTLFAPPPRFDHDLEADPADPRQVGGDGDGEESPMLQQTDVVVRDRNGRVLGEAELARWRADEERLRRSLLDAGFL